MPPNRKQQAETTGVNIFYLLIAFRICNALLVRTFFQPDEYFQSLEPAWDIAFGPSSGAWITWEWRERLRSSLHPFLFAAVYRVTALIANSLHLEAATRAELLLATPKLIQACFAATTDYFIWKLAARAYGQGSRASSAAVSNDILRCIMSMKLNNRVLALLECCQPMAMVLLDKDAFELFGNHIDYHCSMALAFAQRPKTTWFQCYKVRLQRRVQNQQLMQA
ncbi:hypothetical protein E4T48_04782 [Aureobasidium sp. EXF-10727]|nr:hypothetical protein E4T48_04782 [Aureobasidium sp. EXF-10727]